MCLLTGPNNKGLNVEAAQLAQWTSLAQIRQTVFFLLHYSHSAVAAGTPEWVQTDPELLCMPTIRQDVQSSWQRSSGWTSCCALGFMLISTSASWISIVVAEYHMLSALLSREQCHKLAACLWLSTSIDLQGCLLPPLLYVYTALLAQTARLSAGQHTQYSQHNLVLPC